MATGRDARAAGESRANGLCMYCLSFLIIVLILCFLGTDYGDDEHATTKHLQKQCRAPFEAQDYPGGLKDEGGG
jgi:hypothetical protein